MGWARTLLLGDIGNRLDIADTENDISDIRHQLRESYEIDASQYQKIHQLQRENEQMALCLGALVQMMAKKELLSDQERQNLVDMIEG